jgi:hypothetical protein
MESPIFSIKINFFYSPIIRYAIEENKWVDVGRMFEKKNSGSRVKYLPGVLERKMLLGCAWLQENITKVLNINTCYIIIIMVLQKKKNVGI